MGRTFLAEDQRFRGTSNALCVVKEIQPNEELTGTFSLLLRREASRLLSLRHPAIPGYRDFVAFDVEQEVGGCLVQQYIEGQTLQEELEEQGPFSLSRVLTVMRDVLGILDYLHSLVDPQTGESAPLIHLDIKPSNLMRRASDGSIFLIDFGVAAQLSFSTLPEHGVKASVHGFTPGYAPFEQTAGYAVPCSDLYALGITCLVLLTGEHPLAFLDPIEQKTHFRDFVKLPEEGDALFDALLEVRAKHRIQSAQEALQRLAVLEEVLDGGSSAISSKEGAVRLLQDRRGEDGLVGVSGELFMPDTQAVVVAHKATTEQRTEIDEKAAPARSIGTQEKAKTAGEEARGEKGVRGLRWGWLLLGLCGVAVGLLFVGPYRRYLSGVNVARTTIAPRKEGQRAGKVIVRPRQEGAQKVVQAPARRVSRRIARMVQGDSPKRVQPTTRPGPGGLGKPVARQVPGPGSLPQRRGKASVPGASTRKANGAGNAVVAPSSRVVSAPQPTRPHKKGEVSKRKSEISPREQAMVLATRAFRVANQQRRWSDANKALRRLGSLMDRKSPNPVMLNWLVGVSVHGSYWVFLEARKLVASFGILALPALSSYLQKRDVRVRLRAIRLIEQMRSCDAKILALAQANMPVERYAPGMVWLRLLRRCVPGGQETLQKVALFHKSTELRRRTMVALARFGPSVLPVLKKGLSSENRFIRKAALSALSNFGSLAISLIRPFLKDEDRVVRLAARNALRYARDLERRRARKSR